MNSSIKADSKTKPSINISMLDTNPNPIRSLYIAYRVDYSSLTPQQILRQIETEKVGQQQMVAFIQEKLAVGHASPLQQVQFEFLISGVSRAFSHQFVRHHIGIDFEQQSQRYVVFKGGDFPYTVPPSIASMPVVSLSYQYLMVQIADFYNELISKGVPGEDARFVLPNATQTNFKVTVNLLELQHIADERLCLRAQWEFREVVRKMRGLVIHKYPELGRSIAVKCAAVRLGYCNETRESWQACPMGGALAVVDATGAFRYEGVVIGQKRSGRPHKSEVIPG